MSTNSILVVNASARQSPSVTRRLAQSFLEHWLARRPCSSVMERDVGRSPPAIISEGWIEAAFTPDEARTDTQRLLLAESDVLIGELSAAEVVVIATPMYNYGMPAALKAWLDQIVRVGRTFDFDLSRGDYPLRPIMTGKILVALTSCGEFGFGEGAEREGEGHLVSHLHTVSKYLGAAQMHHVGVEYQEFGDARHARSKSAAFAAIPNLVETLVDDSRMGRGPVSPGGHRGRPSPSSPC